MHKQFWRHENQQHRHLSPPHLLDCSEPPLADYVSLTQLRCWTKRNNCQHRQIRDSAMPTISLVSTSLQEGRRIKSAASSQLSSIYFVTMNNATITILNIRPWATSKVDGMAVTSGSTGAEPIRQMLQHALAPIKYRHFRPQKSTIVFPG